MTELDGWKRIYRVLVLCVVATIPSPAQTLKTLVNFNGSNGAFPDDIVQTTSGKLWGTTDGSGSTSCGTVFKTTLAGSLTTPLTFNCNDGPDGDEPGELIQGIDGDFYGVTFFGGSGGGGTVFKLTPSGSLTVLYNFGGSNLPGPVGIVQGSDGDFYGATYGGGSAGYGTVFKITPRGTLTTLYDFDFTHGAQPYAGLIEAGDGNFYGTTYSGGAYGVGTVYKMTPQGALTVLYSFGEHAYDPDFPVTRLVQGKDGDFYGTTPYGGGTDNDGVVYKITLGGVFTTLYAFSGADGYSPGGPLVQATDGSFYGTASGGANGEGIIFKITANDVLTTVHTFDGSDGAGPFRLIQDTNGKFYGLTGGGTSNEGTVFSLNTGLRQFVSFLPPLSSGKVGSKVEILGQGFEGTSGVFFDGIAAGFKVVSDTYLIATVPEGATTGFVTVATPVGTLKSNKKFKVI